MNITVLKPRKALNKAYLKVKTNRKEIELFKANLKNLLNRIDESESEEFHKNVVSDFLKNTYYGTDHFINTKGRTDLVIHNSGSASGSVGVIIEAKKPGNKSEMVRTGNVSNSGASNFTNYQLYGLTEEEIRIVEGN